MTLGRLARLITLARSSVTSTRGQLAHFLAGLSLLMVFPLLVGCVDDASDGEKYTKPTVNAGSDQAHTLPVERLILSGSAKTYPDYLYSIKTTHWRQVSGPQPLVLLNEDELTAMALNPTAAGTYEFELYAKDSLGRTNTDRVTVVLREVAAQLRAASTQGYADDFDVMWTSVTEHYGQYEVIQDQWQQIYQPYLLKASAIESETQWEQLLLDLRAHVQPETVAWQSSGTRVESQMTNGIVTLRIIRVPNGQPHELEQAIRHELQRYPNAQEWVLTGLTASARDLQTELTLFKLFAYQDTSVCLWRRSAEPECYALRANALLGGKPVRMDREGNKETKLTRFLAAQEAGGPPVLLYPDWALGRHGESPEIKLWGAAPLNSEHQ
ncbi:MULTISPECIES: PKD domain-containing protein [Vibrio]|uniref:PKD domain-containing protein n=1 Tax=Vibrio TaxID=662 RepID=UPI0001B95810|nr:MULTISPECIES: hypothetical protein [Vibrio]EEX34328.1 hypothetical protein VIC_001124 [Vibrio coralliilyticus ATCC BAA-450]MDE3898371.1 hypothetical protein [Vibrio sp. CC007]